MTDIKLLYIPLFIECGFLWETFASGRENIRFIAATYKQITFFRPTPLPKNVLFSTPDKVSPSTIYIKLDANFKRKLGLINDKFENTLALIYVSQSNGCVLFSHYYDGEWTLGTDRFKLGRKENYFCHLAKSHQIHPPQSLKLPARLYTVKSTTKVT